MIDAGLDPVIVWIASAALSLVLLVGAIGKLAEFLFFEATLAEYRLLPAIAIRPAAIAVVAAELSGAGLLLLLPTRLEGALLALLLLAVVTGAVVINLLRGRRDIRCGCGGPDHAQTLSWGLVARNLALIGIALLAQTSVQGRDLNWVDLSSIIGGTLAVCGVYFAANQLLANHPRLQALRS